MAERYHFHAKIRTQRGDEHIASLQMILRLVGKNAGVNLTHASEHH